MHAAAATRVLCRLIRDGIRHNVVSQCCVAMLCLWWVYTWCIYVPPAFHLDSIGNEQPAADCPLHGLHPVPYIAHGSTSGPLIHDLNVLMSEIYTRYFVYIMFRICSGFQDCLIKTHSTLSTPHQTNSAHSTHTKQ